MKLLRVYGKHAWGDHEYTMVDDEDFDTLSQYRWTATKNTEGTTPYYGVKCKKDGENIQMSRLLMNFPEGLEVDHKDKNPFNNQKENLRVATKSQNCGNRTRSPRKDCLYWGISKGKPVKGEDRYSAHIKFEGKVRYLGTFTTDEEAASMYDKYAIYCWGEFANLNFLEKLEEYRKVLLEWTDWSEQETFY